MRKASFTTHLSAYPQDFPFVEQSTKFCLLVENPSSHDFVPRSGAHPFVNRLQLRRSAWPDRRLGLLGGKQENRQGHSPGPKRSSEGQRTDQTL